MAYNGSGKRMCTGGETEIDRSNGGAFGGEPRRKRAEAPARPNHILLYSIVNPAYPITVDVIYTISSPHGQVLRIVVFKKNGVQAMVEFESLESATRAKDALQGADIYSGCCTLKIEYAKPDRLNVFKNNQESWDYTIEEENAPQQQRSAPLLQSPQFTGGRPQPYNEDDRRRLPPPPPMERNFFRENGQDEDSSEGQKSEDSSKSKDDMEFGGGGMSQGLIKDMRGPPHRGVPPPHHQEMFQGPGGPQHHGGGGAPPPPPSQQHGCVMMVYGLDPQTANTDRLFNLVCLYGNVARIKFLKTKEGTAMVQMGDALSVERCVQNLNNVTVNDHTMTLAFSKQTFLSEVINPYPLADKSPSFKEYMGNKNNRFLTPASIHKNRIQPPSKIIHFFNTPPDVTEEQLRQVFADYNVTPPLQISKFPLKSERSSSGLMEFSNISQAVTAIMACNHATIVHPGAKFPFLMKLCFSSARSIGPPAGKGGSNMDQSQQQANNKDGMCNNKQQNNKDGLIAHEENNF